MSWERKYNREDIDYDTWYSDWSKLIAKTKSLAEIQKELGVVDAEVGSAAKSHLRAIEKSTSMQGNSSSRAQSKNTLVGASERKIAFNGALEIYELFPEHTKDKGE